jgi:3-dehydrosphinganine reductase
MPSFADTRVLITGGSSGIGRALACALVREGAHVGIVARGEARIDETLAHLRSLAVGPTQVIVGRALDIADTEQVHAAVEPLRAQLGGLDVLINNAGITHPAPMLDTPDAVFREMMQINFFGSVEMTRAWLPTLIATAKPGRGRVVFVSSLAGIIGVYGYSAYASSKFALRGFAECLRQELLGHGIGVSVVLPPDTDTPMLQQENLRKPPETAAVAGTIAPLSAELVAAQTLAGLRRGRAQISPGFTTKLVAWIGAAFPGLTRAVIDRELRGYWKRANKSLTGAD